MSIWEDVEELPYPANLEAYNKLEKAGHAVLGYFPWTVKDDGVTQISPIKHVIRFLRLYKKKEVESQLIKDRLK